MSQPLEITRIDEWRMRELFNTNKLLERLDKGEFTATILESRIAPITAGEPAGTLSQMVSYRDSDNKEVARVHQYLRPDGSIGAKGKPDPKRLFIDGMLFRLEKKPKDDKIADSENA